MESPSISFSDYEILEFLAMFDRERSERHDFYDYAACHGAPTEYFFPGQGQAAYLDRGRRICAQCPVQRECLAFAMENFDDNGLWGGALPEQRRQWLIDGVSADEAWETLLELNELNPIEGL